MLICLIQNHVLDFLILREKPVLVEDEPGSLAYILASNSPSTCFSKLLEQWYLAMGADQIHLRNFTHIETLPPTPNPRDMI